jgi:hypothetical protein
MGVLYIDDTQSLITKNESPDIGFEYSLNPYRPAKENLRRLTNWG